MSFFSLLLILGGMLRTPFHISQNRRKLSPLRVSKRRSLTLLEVMISLSLAAILLAALTTSYYQASKKRAVAQLLKKNSLSTELLRQKLIHLFAQAAAGKSPQFQTASHPQAVGPALYLTFHHEIDINPAFCGDISGILYQSPTNQLCLASWASNGDARVDVLLEQIKSCCFSFFDPNKKVWRPSWEKKGEFPPFFKLSWWTLEQPNEAQECAFFFPQTVPIQYETQVPMP